MVSEFSKLPFLIFSAIGQVGWKGVLSLISNNGSIPVLKMPPGKFFPRTFLAQPEGSVVQTSQGSIPYA